MDEYQVGLNNRVYCHSSSSVQQMHAPSPSPTVNRLCASGGPTSPPPARVRFLVKRRPAKVEGHVGNMSLSFGDKTTEGVDGTTGVGFRQRRLAVSAVHWMWGLIVPHPGSGNPSGPSLCFRAANLSAPPVRSCVFPQPTEPTNHKRTTDLV